MTVVKEIMKTDMQTVSPQENLDKIYELMIQNRLLHIPVVDAENHLLGVVSHPNIVQTLYFAKGKIKTGNEHDLLKITSAQTVMDADPVTVKPDEPLQRAGLVMMDSRKEYLPVVEDDHLVGLLTDDDFVRYVAIHG